MNLKNMKKKSPYISKNEKKSDRIQEGKNSLIKEETIEKKTNLNDNKGSSPKVINSEINNKNAVLLASEEINQNSTKLKEESKVIDKMDNKSRNIEENQNLKDDEEEEKLTSKKGIPQVIQI